MKNGTSKTFIITILRLAIGWHFLWEGISKLFVEDWSAAPYLKGSMGLFSGFYHWLSSSELLLKFVDPLNIYGLMLIGLFLAIGYGTRIAALCGGLLLTLYYFAYITIQRWNACAAKIRLGGRGAPCRANHHRYTFAYTAIRRKY